MLILGLLGMYFDAAVVFVTNSSLFFRLAVAILCWSMFRLKAVTKFGSRFYRKEKRPSCAFWWNLLPICIHFSYENMKWNTIKSKILQQNFRNFQYILPWRTNLSNNSKITKFMGDFIVLGIYVCRTFWLNSAVMNSAQVTSAILLHNWK